LRLNLAWSNSRRAWSERGAFLALLAGGAALLRWGDELPAAVLLLLGALLLLAAALLLRRGWLRLFGPVLFYDLVRTARRLRSFAVAVGSALLVLALLGSVYGSYSPRGEIPPNRVADAAATFFKTFLDVQLLVVILLTPAYTAGAIAEEKDRRTLEFLLATD